MSADEIKDDEILDDQDESVVMIISNDPSEFKVRTLELFYQAASYGGIAYMDGKDPETGDIVPLLVGVKMEAEGQFSIWPIAKIFQSNDIKNYLVPDGAGNYSEPDRDLHGPDVEAASRQAEGLNKNQIN
jgi:hypothetical protein